MNDEQSSVDLDGPAIPRPDDAQSRRNYTLGIFSGALGTLMFAFLHPEMILGGMIYALTDSYLLVALVSVASKAGMLAPQLLAGGLEHLPRKRPYYIALAAARIGALVVMLALLVQLAAGPTPLYVAGFFAAYLVSCMCMGVAYAVFMDMAGRMIPDGRIGSYFGTRQSLGGLLALICGAAVIHPILNKLPLSTRYVVVFAIAIALAVVSATLFALCREQPGPIARERPTLGQSLRRGVGWLRTSRDYRSYFWQRVAFRVTDLGMTFFIPHGKRVLAQAADAASVAALGGIMVATLTASRTAAGFLWGRRADRRGYRGCMLWAGVLFAVGPALALLAAVLPRAFALPLPLTEVALDLPMLVYLLALAAMGAALQATVIGGNRFIVVTAPEHRRMSYLGFLNTATSPLTLLPLAAAWMAHKAGTWTVFVVVAAGGVMYLAAALRMTPDRKSALANSD